MDEQAGKTSHRVRNVGIGNASPRVAAKLMNLPYEEIYATRTRLGWTLDGSTFYKKPELIAKAYYTSQGLSCEYGENGTVSILMTALADPLIRSKRKLARVIGLSNTRGWTKLEEDGLRRYVQNALIRNDPATVVQVMSNATERDLRWGLKAERDCQRELKTILPDYRGSDDHFVNMWRLLGRDTISRLAKHHVDRTAYRGWPDLTLIRGKTVSFVEVKTINDRFQETQIDLWLNVGKPLGLVFGVVTVEQR